MIKMWQTRNILHQILRFAVIQVVWLNIPPRLYFKESYGCRHSGGVFFLFICILKRILRFTVIPATGQSILIVFKLILVIFYKISHQGGYLTIQKRLSIFNWSALFDFLNPRGIKNSISRSILELKLIISRSNWGDLHSKPVILTTCSPRRRHTGGTRTAHAGG